MKIAIGGNMDGAFALSTLKGATLLAIVLSMPLIVKAQAVDSSKVNDLLKEARTHAVLAEDDAQTLEGYTRSKLSLQSHATRVHEMREHANDLIRDFNRINSIRAEASPWQQEAIDRINPLLQEMAAHLNATINHLNDNQNRIHMPQYQEYVHANRELMTKTARLISEFSDYSEAKTMANELEKKLELPAVAREGDE
jgi:hypothetical protein